MEWKYLYWVMYLACLHALTMGHITPPKYTNTKRAPEISMRDTSKGEVTVKQQLSQNNRHLGEDLNDIGGLITQLSYVINQLQGMDQGQSSPGLKEGCLTNKKGKLKCKKPIPQSQNKGTKGSVEHFQSLHNLFSNVSTSFSFVQNKLLEDIVRLIMESVVENTNTLTQHLEHTILNLTETVHTRLNHLEEYVLRILPPETQPQLTEDNISYPDTPIITDAPTLEQSPMQEPSKGNDTEPLLKNAIISGYSININFTDFIKCYWVCHSLPHHNVTHPWLAAPNINETRNKSTGELPAHYWNEIYSLIWKFQLAYGIDLPGVTGVLVTALLVLAGGVAVAVLLWSCHRAWRDESDYAPSHINKSADHTNSGLTVVTVSTYKSTHAQVETIINRLISSDKNLQPISEATKFIEIQKNSTIKEDLLDKYSEADKLLVVIDVSQDEKEALLEVQDELREKTKALSLEDICTALGDIVIIIYGDSASRQLPLGAIYNTTVVEKLPVPALRALCRVGRFLTVNTAFTNTQTLLLQHWLQTPAKVHCEEDV